MRPGELWLARITFASGNDSKIRPVLVLWVDAADVVVAAVTSAAPRTGTDIPILDWEPAGLRVPSTVRLRRLDTIEGNLLLRRIGHLSSGDAGLVSEAWSRHMALSF